MDEYLFPNQRSQHSVILLGNLDDNFESMPDIDGAKSYRTKGTNDLAVIGNVELYSTIDQLCRMPGLISSRTLILKDKITSDLVEHENYGILMADSMHGHESELQRNLTGIVDTYAVYNSAGIYNTVAFVTYDDEQELRAKVNSIPNIRHATLLRTNGLIEPIDVVKEPQLITARHYDTRNKYEDGYENDIAINKDYARGCIEMAKRFLELEADRRVSMIYAPLRGAKSMVDVMMEAYRRLQTGSIDVFRPKIIYPVTSSFVIYPKAQPYLTKKGRSPASGRATNILELKRLLEKDPESLENILYVDEIISGGMLLGHTREMVEPSQNPRKHGVLSERVNDGQSELHVFGLTHAHGEKFSQRKEHALKIMENRGLMSFEKFFIDNLITEDQRFLLGLHYLINHFGPHTIPFINADREYREEHSQFWDDCMKILVC